MTEMRAEGPQQPTNLRCEYLQNPMGIETPRPRLSWWVSDDRRGAVQSAYRILVASDLELLEEDRGDVWDSGKVASDRSIQVGYGGPELRSRQRCWWKVRTWDADDAPSPWSGTARWEMGLLRAEDWSAEWIGMPKEEASEAATYLRGAFELDGTVVRARAYATALGVYELRLNGQKVGDHVFPPGWTDYKKRVMYQTYDVTGMLRKGENALGAILGDGWYCGRLGWGEKPEEGRFGGRPPRFLLQLEVEFEDGTSRRIVTDGSWRWATGPILRSDFYDGERYDARLEMPGWDAPGYDADWQPVAVFEDPGIVRNAQQDPPIRVTEEIEPVSVGEVSPGVRVVDMGQNMVGFCRLRVAGPEGTEVRLRHAEVLDPDGTISTENLRTADATDTYVLRGEGTEVYQPRFTYHGFRYVEVTGWPGEPKPADLAGLVVHTDCEPTGSLETSSELVNRLHENILWGQRGNMHSVLTDCPQRDERLGWMGDAQVFAPTACYNMDMAAMLTKFARDMLDAQTAEGAFPDVCPYISPEGVLPPAGAPAWMDAGVIVPWTVYRYYGDRRILERHFDSMCRYVDYVFGKNPDGIWENARGNDYGDWVPAGEQTDKTMFATLHLFYSATLVARIARVLDRPDEEERYRTVAEKVRTAFNDRYLGEDGTYQNATQTIDALALAWGVVPEESRERVARDLVENIEDRDGHLSTGFGGTQWLLPALCEAGHDEVARRLLLNRDYPSWGYMIEQGATTVWELWNSDTEGPGMNSRNHFAYGSVGEWLFGFLAGIRTDGDDWARFTVRPFPPAQNGELTHVKATYRSIRGTIVSDWRLTEVGLELNVRVPPNARAVVHLPAGSAEGVTEGGLPVGDAGGVTVAGAEGGRLLCEVGAGRYRFLVPQNS